MSRTQAEGSTDHPEGKELHAYQPLNANTNIVVDKAHHGQLGEHFAPGRSFGFTTQSATYLPAYSVRSGYQGSRP